MMPATGCVPTLRPPRLFSPHKDFPWFWIMQAFSKALYESRLRLSRQNNTMRNHVTSVFGHLRTLRMDLELDIDGKPYCHRDDIGSCDHVPPPDQQYRIIDEKWRIARPSKKNRPDKNVIHSIQGLDTLDIHVAGAFGQRIFPPPASRHQGRGRRAVGKSKFWDEFFLLRHFLEKQAIRSLSVGPRHDHPVAGVSWIARPNLCRIVEPLNSSSSVLEQFTGVRILIKNGRLPACFSRFKLKKFKCDGCAHDHGRVVYAVTK